MNQIMMYIKNPARILARLICGKAKWMPDEMYIKIMYRANTGKKLNLTNPKTYNEKLQWLKLYDQREEYTTLVDKYSVKQYVAAKIGEQYLIPTLGVWNTFDQIDFDRLPQAFVLKCTHDSGSVVICRDKGKLNKQAARVKLEKALKANYFYRSREYPYKHVPPRIIAEPYLENLDAGQLYDYKVFCFHGKPEFLFIASDRASGNVKFDYYDAQFHRLPMRQAAHPNSTIDHAKPDCFDELMDIAQTLSEGIPQVRVDVYIVDNHIIFGEMTFFHHGGFVPFIPEEYDYLWGEKIHLPQKESKHDHSYTAKHK